MASLGDIGVQIEECDVLESRDREPVPFDSERRELRCELHEFLRRRNAPSVELTFIEVRTNQRDQQLRDEHRVIANRHQPHGLVRAIAPTS